MILFGLGNPGRKYYLTRHNTGFLFLNHLCRDHHRRFRAKERYKVASIRIRGQDVRLVKPQCWMNRSGIEVQRYLEKDPGDFMVVLDDINLPLGRIRLRAKGSDGGHLGLRSVIEKVGSDKFPRLRIGVGQPYEDAVDYVLDRFKQNEKKVLDQVIALGIEGIEIFLFNSISKAQNFVNSIDLIP